MSNPTPLMIVRAVADLHGRLPVIDPCEVLLIAGDVVPESVEADVAGSRAWLAGPFAAWLDQIAAQHVVMVAGNHDPWALFAPPPAEVRAIYLADEQATIQTTLGPLQVWGSPWTPSFSGGAFEADEPGLAVAAGLIPDDTDILVLHGPPYGCGDAVPRQGPRRGLESAPRWQDRVGSRAHRDAVTRVQPALCVFGHIHAQGGHSNHVGATRCANVAVRDDRGTPPNVSAFVLARDNDGRLWAEPFPPEALPPASGR